MNLAEYVSLIEVIKICREQGLEVKLKTLRWQVDNGKIPEAIRDENDIRKRRLIPSAAVQGILSYNRKLKDIAQGKQDRRYYAFAKLAEDTGAGLSSLYANLRKGRIRTLRAGNNRVMDKIEYEKWKIILGRKQWEKKICISTGYVGRAWGIPCNMVLYWIRKRIIPASRIGYFYRILGEDFEKHGDEWKKRCGYS